VKKRMLNLALVMAMVGLLAYAAAAVAASPPTGGQVTAGGVVNNVAPVIDSSSCLIQLSDGKGTNWQWKKGVQTGTRPAPYIFEGEKLHIEMGVSDPNGASDLKTMSVKVNLGPAINFYCPVVGSPVSSNVTAHYSGDLLIDAKMAQGKYPLIVSATDPDGLSSSFDPSLFVWLKPTLSLEIGKPTLTFASAKPGDQNIAAVENPLSLTPLAMIGSEHVPVIFSLSQQGVDMTSTSGSLTTNNILWSLTGQPNAAAPATAASQGLASGITEGSTTKVYYWLNIPSPQASGKYTGQISYQITGN
jgi:hypothetical protein